MRGAEKHGGAAFKHMCRAGFDIPCQAEATKLMAHRERLIWRPFEPPLHACICRGQESAARHALQGRNLSSGCLANAKAKPRIARDGGTDAAGQYTRLVPLPAGQSQRRKLGTAAIARANRKGEFSCSPRQADRTSLIGQSGRKPQARGACVYAFSNVDIIGAAIAVEHHRL